MTIKVCEETIMALMEASKGFETRIKQLEVGIEAAEQHIAGKSAAVRVFKRILRDTNVQKETIRRQMLEKGIVANRIELTPASRNDVRVAVKQSEM